MNDIHIIEITKNNLKITNKINELLGQLSSNFENLSFAKINDLIMNKNVVLLGVF